MGRTSERGFTLIEAMVVSGISLILAAIAVPWFYALSQETGLVSAQRDVMTALYLARSANRRLRAAAIDPDSGPNPRGGLHPQPEHIRGGCQADCPERRQYNLRRPGTH
jgi:prepilin-type N-terminal cleavage/methylation domain-containing protein